jgi:hypothetical protein
MLKTSFYPKLLFITFILSMALIPCCNAPDINKKADQIAVPEAKIDSIVPDTANQGETITFNGHGISSEGIVVGYQWRSSLDGDISQMSSFVKSSLSVGTHVMFFRVLDNKGNWSGEDQRTITVVPGKKVLPPIIDYFNTEPGRISLGSSSILSWHVTGATVVNIEPDIGNVAMTGNSKVSPGLSTMYTLTAVNEGIQSSAAQTTVLVVPGRIGLPVINSFTAAPGNIQAGQSTILNWDVFNADTVKIDPAVSTTEPSGSFRVSPSSTTTYTLTASNSVGMVVSTTQVLVSAGSVSGVADLVITDISKVETPSGARIVYSVENRGTNDAPPSTTKIYANGVFMASDSLGIVPAGGSVARQINGGQYNPATNIIKITLDADNNLIEKDKSNNSKTVVVPVKTMIDFVEDADHALWGVEYPYKSLVFGGPPIEKDGFVLYQVGKNMEDGSVQAKVLETRPVYTYNGWIRGDYTSGMLVKPGDTFYGLVGLLEGAQSGDVEFLVYIRPHGQGEWDILVPGVWDLYDYKLRALAVLIPPSYFGMNVDFSLVASTHGDPLQDWAVWVEAKILR